ncbi:hypothetical protein BU14_0603s0003 [Porphyra umbilicalis]|uniref:Uncharacterized protein n=1 Tax=Porphyra umbilicalis TaxID=2786 RepID=A0A1X6NR85_PORUM|nr:hypothetical protein BU14_0603s0003 [Porphyra umbilicalis]OSX71083.1 hypothetical protein BU14_0603s0003 [Porphyra umbilicalis]OSX71084.1 hypothetical protein BU14_0603s0003 [Porphyra umbilicalis]OSX71085.1 hypothetical protein BU14_0603s0003 [Porphyra umbilicalis]OSX71086.1 hypothetical protein BU14_0603s0003 [Porphyra umbilicalis]|eukprot:OSX71082.1 hypothetical protein BU14_0603s0003 [Porphyra umbilicalis]
MTCLSFSITRPPVAGAADCQRVFRGTVALTGDHRCGDTNSSVGCRWEPAEDRPAGAVATTVDSSPSACRAWTCSPYASRRHHADSCCQGCHSRARRGGGRQVGRRQQVGDSRSGQGQGQRRLSLTAVLSRSLGRPRCPPGGWAGNVCSAAVMIVLLCVRSNALGRNPFTTVYHPESLPPRLLKVTMGLGPHLVIPFTVMLLARSPGAVRIVPLPSGMSTISSSKSNS